MHDLGIAASAPQPQALVVAGGRHLASALRPRLHYSSCHLRLAAALTRHCGHVIFYFIFFLFLVAPLQPLHALLQQQQPEEKGSAVIQGILVAQHSRQKHLAAFFILYS